MSTVEHKIYANSSTGEDLLLWVRVRPVQTVAASTSFSFFSDGRDVDLSAEVHLHLAERRRQVCGTWSANDHHIHVTRCMFPASCRGTIDKTTPNLAPKRLEHVA
jgi:hypothetical protein